MRYVSAEMNMQLQFRRCTVNCAKGMKTVVLSLILGLGGGISQSSAQGADGDVGYVESVGGRLVPPQDAPKLLALFDTIAARPRLDLPANSELRICHFRTGKILTLRGPLRASVS